MCSDQAGHEAASAAPSTLPVPHEAASAAPSNPSVSHGAASAEPLTSSRSYGALTYSAPELTELLRERVRARRQILFSKDDQALAPLAAQIDAAPRQALVLWALELADEVARDLQVSKPQDLRPGNAVALARSWAAGEITMPIAKRGILDCHAGAKDASDAAQAARYHAVGQGCSVVHTTGHALGLPMYELTALAHDYGVEACAPMILRRLERYSLRLRHWCECYRREPRTWAPFLKERE